MRSLTATYPLLWLQIEVTHSVLRLHIEPETSAAQIATTAHVLSARRFRTAFTENFVPDRVNVTARQNLLAMSGRAAQALITLCAEMRANVGQATKVDRGRRKFQVRFKLK